MKINLIIPGPEVWPWKINQFIRTPVSRINQVIWESWPLRKDNAKTVKRSLIKLFPGLKSRPGRLNRLLSSAAKSGPGTLIKLFVPWPLQVSVASDINQLILRPHRPGLAKKD